VEGRDGTYLLRVFQWVWIYGEVGAISKSFDRRRFTKVDILMKLGRDDGWWW